MLLLLPSCIAGLQRPLPAAHASMVLCDWPPAGMISVCPSYLRFLSLERLLLLSRLLLCSLLESRSLRLCFSFLLRSRLLSLLRSLLTDLSRSAGAPFGSSSRPLIGLPPFSDMKAKDRADAVELWEILYCKPAAETVRKAGQRCKLVHVLQQSKEALEQLSDACCTRLICSHIQRAGYSTKHWLNPESEAQSS
jgi:hypothetical protein